MVPKASLAYPSPHDPKFERFLAGLKEFYLRPCNYFLEPFQIFGNLYYIGDKKVCSHLIDTGDGLIVFDTGFRNAMHMQLESIRRLGFDPKDIKYIIHSHEHFDHFGGSNDFRTLFGCKICMSKAGTELLRERPDRALCHLGPMVEDEIPWPDIELEDGDVLTLGNTSIRCVLTPGHTGGVMTFFFDVIDGETTYRAGYFGGAGYLTAIKDYCRQFGLPENMLEQMVQSTYKVWDEHVDIMLGNHPNQNCTLEKRQWMIDHPGENPFIDPDAWHYFLTLIREGFSKAIEDGF